MLDNINLLDWRAVKRRNYQRRFWLGCSASLTLALLMVGVSGGAIERQIALQQTRITQLNQLDSRSQQQNADYQRRWLRHQWLEMRLDEASAWQARRNQTIEVLDHLPQLVGDGIYLQELDIASQQTSLKGFSDSTAQLTAMIRRFEQAPHFAALTVHSIVHDQGFQQFHLSLALQQSATPGDRDD